MTKPQIIKTETGEELIVLTRRDYDDMIASLASEAAEDAALARLAAEREDELGLPVSVWEEIEAAPSPIGPLRKWRNMSQDRLAEAAGISQSYLSQIESGKKTGDLATLQAIAKALAVGLTDILPDD